MIEMNQTAEAGRQPRVVLYVDASMLEKKGYRPVFVKEGESGYYPQGGLDKFQEPWYFGHDLAEAKRRCDEYNARRGVTREEADAIVFGSMFGH